jgi:sulfide:quinone oxidoreductase
MTTSVLVLGAGFGGLELSSRLSRELGDQVDVTLIDRADAFVFGFSKLDIMFGKRTPEAVRLPYRDLAMPHVWFRQETITAIDPEARRVVTDHGAYEADVPVVALGAGGRRGVRPGEGRLDPRRSWDAGHSLPGGLRGGRRHERGHAQGRGVRRARGARDG